MTRCHTGLDVEAACHIIANLRAVDHKEIYAVRQHDEGPQDLLRDIMAVSQHGHTFTWFAKDGTPVALNGYYEQWPGVANVWAFGTDRWSETVLAVTKHVRRVIVPSLIAEGYHRAECCALHERADTRKWLPLLGLRLEAVLAGFGRQREDFGLYVWKPDHVHENERSRAASPNDAAAAAGTAGRAGSPREGRRPSGTSERGRQNDQQVVRPAGDN